jgi:HK97 gp10 family phage protein
MASQTPGGNPMVTIIGLPELNAQLDAFAREVSSGPFVEAALTAGALPVQNRWKQLAPFLSGRYRSSIHTEIIRNGTEPAAEVGTDITDPPYPLYLEYGTSRMGPRPSMRPAYDEGAPQAVQEITDVLNALLSKYGGK